MIQQLQRGVGNRAVGRLLGGQAAAPVQRRILDGDAILAGVPDVLRGNKLGSEGGELGLGTTLHGDTTLKERVEAILDTYETQFVRGKPDAVTTNAMKILAALAEIGRVIARRLHLAQEAPTITRALLASQKDRLTSALMVTAPKSAPKGQGALSDTQAAAALTMAETLAGDDPVGKFVQGKLPLPKAETIIRHMAGQLGKEPLAVFELLRQQYESRIGSLTQASVTEQEIKAPEGYMFPLKDLYGEVSVKFFTNLVQLDPGGTAKWGSNGLETVAKKDRESWEEGSGSGKHTYDVGDLEQLRAAVARKADPAEPFATSKKKQHEKGWDRLNARQMEYLSNLDDALGNDEESRAKLALLSHFVTTGKLSQEKALAELNRGIANLRTKPITLTTKAQDMLLPSGEVVDEYKPFFSVFMKKQSLSKALPSIGIETEIRLVEDALGRGVDYGQYRMEKDDAQIGDSPLSVEDLPAMACVNYAFEINPGPNYYGDTHFVLHPDVRKRAVLSFGTGSPERRSEILLLHDVLQTDANKVNQLCDGTYALQDIEVHVYGNIRLQEDVARFHLGNPNALTNADTRGGKDVPNVPGTPTEKLRVLRTILDAEVFEKLVDIWVNKQKGTDKLRELIARLNLDKDVVDSNLEEIGDTQTVDKTDFDAPLVTKDAPPPTTDPGKQTKSPKGATGKKGKNGCYITTACLTARGLPDDCEELQVLRRFRDDYMLPLAGGRGLVEFYYDQSPRIIEAIAEEEDPAAIYDGLYAVIRHCVDAILDERPRDAFTTYVTMVLGLRDRFAADMVVPATITTALCV